LEKLYLDYKSEKFGIDIGFLPASVEQSFLAYILTYYTTHPKKYKKTKFYSYFHYLIDTFETDLDSYPVFYSQSQLKLLTGSLALIETTLLKELYNEESNKLKRLGGSRVDIDEFMRYRTLTTVKTLNITNNTSIVPFIDMFENDPIDYNINFKLNETTKDLYVFTTKPIYRDSILYIRSGHFSNNKRFVIYGQTFEKMKDYIEAFQIPMISYKLQQQIKVEDENFEYEESIDLVKKKFYKKALDTYKKLSKYNKEDGSDISAYKLFLKNLEMSREVYNDVSSSDIYREFVKAKDINNVIRVLSFEKKFMDEKIGVLRKYIHKLEKNEKREKKYEKDINKDL
jgi:tetratricopeptide (TPR) repeat protein